MSALDKSIQNEGKHAVYLQRFAGGLSREMEPFLNQLKKSLKAELMQLDMTMHRGRKFKRILKSIEEMQRNIYSEFSEELLGQLELFTEHEIAFEVGSLDSVILSGSVEISAPATVQVWAAATTDPLIFPHTDGNILLKPYTRNWSEKHISRVSNIITNGMTFGETNQQIVSRIVGKGKLIDKRVRADMKTVVRTATSHISTVARQKTFDDNGDIVIGYEWVSTLDDRTSPLCQPLDGEIFYNNKSGYKPKPPLHPNCRSTTSPVFDKRYLSDDEDSTRASSMGRQGKQVDAKETYYSLLKKQDRDYVMETLGPTRGKLFLDGGLSVEEFKNLTTDQKFRPLSISAMRQKDPQLFTKIGI